MSEAKRQRTVTVLGNRVTLAVTRATLGLGTVALLLSGDHTHTSGWKIGGWIGFGVFFLSLPPQIYDTYLRYQRRCRDERKPG